MSTKAKILAGIVAVLFLALVVWTVQTIPQGTEQTQNEAAKRVMTYDGNTISEEKDGHKIWELTAEHIEMDLDTKSATLTGVTGHFYAADGRVVDVQAAKGHYDAESRDVTIEDGLAITTSDGASLKSEQLLWTSATETLTAQGDAYVARDDMQAQGASIASTNGFKQFTIEGPLYITKGDMQATGDHLATNEDGTRFTLTGHAHIQKE